MRRRAVRRQDVTSRTRAIDELNVTARIRFYRINQGRIFKNSARFSGARQAADPDRMQAMSEAVMNAQRIAQWLLGETVHHEVRVRNANPS